MTSSGQNQFPEVMLINVEYLQEYITNISFVNTNIFCTIVLPPPHIPAGDDVIALYICVYFIRMHIFYTYAYILYAYILYAHILYADHVTRTSNNDRLMIT